ncbi:MULTISPECIES: glycosyltransferase family 1 protein [unclassified Lysobacter]|uniref:glycosyltransferase family 4 protein n=1 Tax=unclassified Lysobacter TaxID=2635362 RepID=UPI001BE85DB4|nr:MULTISPECIES: glycosyltransferase family 1 protein [unclassified Lysobacter]MBT2747126.1 glycosyltransferase family 1 protein [Lysobacter sp. ISL-42]MBT2752932.1 glycosyltransferase family 1 protein [Lysobacter sp. ISL-50]MBT2778907.1 glycosyltransferase family 1 protein [Lysobacter sp. ISL-54]MBT2784199.1 glycosyltransferase family 1 protein [Lysobacter sp. ISL-52]
MRYAIVTETYPPEINGVALTVQGLERGLRARGHQVDLVRPRQDADGGGDGEAHELLVRGLPLPRYPGLRFGLPCAGRLIQAWTRDTPDAIYVATEGPLGGSALKAARRLGIPAATGFHTRFDEYMRDYGAPFLVGTALAWMRRFHNGADATLVPTRELAEFLRARGFEDVVRLPRAVDTELFDPRRRNAALRREWGLDDDGFAAIYVGRIAPEKNLDLAVRAFRALQQQRPQARFVWVGDGPAREKLQRDNPDFIFCGLKRGEVLAEHFASGDMFLFPSHSETFGNVTLEAMASGVPTVAFDYGAAHEHLRDGLHGAAIADGDDAGFIRAAARIGSQDALRAGMSRAGREAISGLRPQQVAADFDALLHGLAERNATGRGALRRLNDETKPKQEVL